MALTAVHLAVGRAGYACHVERVWPTLQVTSVRNPAGVDCRNCLRTRAFQQAQVAP